MYQYYLPVGSRLSMLGSEAIGVDARPIWSVFLACSYLPLTDKWQDGKFALRDVLAPWGAADSREKNVREWTLRALERYRFVIGSTPSHFAMLSSPSDATTLAHKFSTKNMAKTDVALLCVNDDVVIDDDKVARLFKNWARERWGKKASWEV